MGMKSSPHGYVKMQSLGEEIVCGNHLDPSNPFYYYAVRLNLPGDPSYNPRLAKVSKLDSRTGTTAGDMLTYVDDTRTTGRSSSHCWAVSHRTSTRLCYLGMQDALRKRTLPSQRAGAWTGSLTQTPSSGIVVSCTQEKWTRARQYISDLQTTLQDGGHFDHKDLERKRGFLVYVARTYPSLMPFLKGIHLTLDGWRPGRDDDGWPLQGQLACHLDVDPTITPTAPATVTAIPRLAGDLQALSQLMASDTPPERIIRSSSVMVALYGFGDDSGAGFGSTILSGTGTHYRFGIWGNDLVGASSNYRELFNLTAAAEDHVNILRFEQLSSLVNAVSAETTSTSLAGCELYLFTDNSVTEGAFFKGTSSNPRLFSLVVRLKQLELRHGFVLQVIHVAGRRMQQQGADGLSRGDLLTGVMAGAPMLDYVPLHLGVLERSPPVLQWIQSWVPPSHTVIPLQPIDWFQLGHGITTWLPNLDGLPTPICGLSGNEVLVWALPPAAAHVAVEQLSYSRTKRPFLSHVFVVPRLMTSLWRKQLFKLAD
jgi:hypothetical protein